VRCWEWLCPPFNCSQRRPEARSGLWRERSSKRGDGLSRAGEGEREREERERKEEEGKVRECEKREQTKVCWEWGEIGVTQRDCLSCAVV